MCACDDADDNGVCVRVWSRVRGFRACVLVCVVEFRWSGIEGVGSHSGSCVSGLAVLL